MKYRVLLLMSMMALGLLGCKKYEVLYSYSPQDPKAGETIRFTNTTEEGEEWAWSFGDGTTSSSKSPSKVYKRAGQYTVTLKVDDKNFRTCTKTITVVDTIPTIGVGDTIVYYYQPVVLTALFYNPFSHTITYEWNLPKGTKIIEGETDEKTITVCFTQSEKDVEVSLKLTDGDQTTQIDTTLYVYDSPATSLLIGRQGEVLRQRVYTYGYEEAIPWCGSFDKSSIPTAAYVLDQQLYVFNSSSISKGTITKYDTESGSQVLITSQEVGVGFENGYLYNHTLYWTAGDEVYSAPLQGENRIFTKGSSSPMFVASAKDLGLTTGKQAGGLVYYNGYYLLAYDKGLHRFSKNGQTIEKQSSLLNEYQINNIAHDPIAKKLYFTTSNGLYVANFADGSNVNLLDANADGRGLTVSNTDNRLYWTTQQGVYCQPLIQTANNNHHFEPSLVNEITDITSLGFDQVAR